VSQGRADRDDEGESYKTGLEQMLHDDPPSGSRPLRLSLERLKTVSFINNLALEWIMRSSFRTSKAAHSLKALVRVADGTHWPATATAN
jgi:hypothetical protein